LNFLRAGSSTRWARHLAGDLKRLVNPLALTALVVATVNAASGIPSAQAQSFEVVLEHCRASVGHSIVHSCMMNKHGMGDRESNLEECRTHARPEVSKCIAAAMAHGQSQTASAGEARTTASKPERLAEKPKPHATPEKAPAEAAPAVASPQIAVTDPHLAQPLATIPAFGRRVALLIGNGDYEHVPTLPNATNDAKAIAAAFTAAGFQSVTLKTNLKRDEVVSALSDFARIADTADWAVVYYSGHGIEYRGTNYIIPTDARLLMDRDIDLETVDIGKVMTVVDGAKHLRLIILDACRNNPFLDQMKRTVASRAITRGLAPVEPDAGSLIVYAAKHGETALDGDGKNSPFATALLHRIQTPNLEIRRLFDLVRDDVLTSTNKQQQPFTYGSLSGSEDFYFAAK
jgi:Caspase domain